MPNIACQGWAAIPPASVCQLATRPESTPSVRVNKYSAEKERRSQYICAKVGKIHHVSRAPAAASAASAATRARRTQRRLHHIKTTSATATLSREAREWESPSAAKNPAPPATRALRD